MPIANPTISPNAFEVSVPIWSSIAYSVVGFPFANTSPTATTTAMSGSFGIRKQANIQITPVTTVDAAGKEQLNGYLAKTELDLYQTDAYSFWNVYQLSKQLVQIAPQLWNSDYWNFVSNQANPPFQGTATSPSGSVALGMDFAWECTTKDLTNKVTLEGKMHPLELSWLLANSTTSSTIGSGGIITQSLSSLSYSQLNYGIPGINSLTVSANTTFIFSDDTKISIKSMTPEKDNRERPIGGKFMEIEIDGKCLQDRYNDLQSFVAKSNTDFSATANLWNSMVLIFNNSLSITTGLSEADGKGALPFKMKGRIAFDPNGVQNYIVYDGANTFTFNRSIYNP